MVSKHFIVATAGHVDHGKSALVKALTGIDPDRLPEEKARGITIDLGFAHLELSTFDPHPSTFHLGIVDVPGHEDFVRNMVAGVGSIDLALFVVAADDGWMPQTEEHLQILGYLGVTRAVIALTKVDLLESESARADAMAQVRERLAGSPFAAASVIPTSVLRSVGLDELKAALTRVLAETALPRDLGKPRLPVDRVFTLRGIGTVVTGTLSGGILRRGQEVIVQPAGRKTRIRTLQSHNRDVEKSGPGTRTALSLPDVEAQTESGLAGIRRGDVVTLPELGSPSDTLDVRLERSARLQSAQSGAVAPLKDGALVWVHHGSGHFAARVCLLATTEIGPGQTALAQLRAVSPVFAFVGDRFIVRDWAEQRTLAGGLILDAGGSRRGFRGEARRRCLERCASASDEAHSVVAALLERDQAVRRLEVLRRSRFSALEISDAIARLVARGDGIEAGDWVIEAAAWRRWVKQAAEAIDLEHRVRPQNIGMALAELRSIMEPVLPSPELFDALVSHLNGSGYRQVGAALGHSHHRPALPASLQAAGQRLRARLSVKPFDPPSRKELAPDPMAQLALRFLLETGEAIDLGGEVVLLADAYARMTAIVQECLRRSGSATVSELRQAIGGSRRVMIPFLERLDREGVTRREGDKRSLRSVHP